MKQLRCPKCGHEFGYDNGYYDRNIERLGHEIADLNRQLAQHKLLPFPEQKRRTDWWLRTKKALAEKQEQLGELKAIRKAADQQLNYRAVRGCRRELLHRPLPAFWMPASYHHPGKRPCCPAVLREVREQSITAG